MGECPRAKVSPTIQDGYPEVWDLPKTSSDSMTIQIELTWLFRHIVESVGSDIEEWPKELVLNPGPGLELDKSPQMRLR